MSDESTKYVVDILFNIHDKPGAKMGPIHSEARKLKDELAGVGLAFANSFTGAVERVGALTMGAAKLGVVGAAAATAFGLTLNNELEQTQISLAAVMNANLGGGMAYNMGEASKWMTQMRKDAKDLPGEFEDLKGIIASSAGSAFQAGMDVKGFERIASQSMAAGKALAVPLDQAGRELALLFEGRAGSHNKFGTRLGLQAAGFNDKSGAERVKMIEEALGKFQPAIATFSGSFDAISSTLMDSAKTFIGAATGPLFNRIKGTLAEANTWLDANEATTQRWATQAGTFLEDAFLQGKAIVMEYGPEFLTFAKNAKAEFLSIWKEAKPVIKDLGADLKAFLHDDDSLGKIETILKLYAATKIGGAAFSVGRTVGNVVNGASQMGLFSKIGSVFGAGSAASTVGGAAATAGEVGAVAGTGGAVGGGGGLAALGISAGAAAAALVALTAAVGASVYLMDQAEKKNDAVRENYVQNHLQASMMVAVGLENASGMIDTSGADYMTTLAKLRANSESTALAYEEQVREHNRAIVVGAQLTDSFVTMNTKIAGLLVGMPRTNLVEDSPGPDAASVAKADEERRKKALAGKGGITIHKVEVTVASNRDPNQIARQVGSWFVDQKRYAQASPGVRNFNAGR